MAVTATRVTVATTAILLASDNDGGSILIKNTGAGSIYLGPSDVTSATGYELLTLMAVSIDLWSEAVYAISASGSNVAAVLRTGA